MAAEESTAMSYEKIYDMGTGLIIAKVQLSKGAGAGASTPAS